MKTNGVMFQFFQWYLSSDGSHWRFLSEYADELSSKGISAIWIPPPYKGAGGPDDVGYAIYDLFDLGEFDQKGSVRTKYGTREELEHAVERIHASGMDCYVDIVLNHRMGADRLEQLIATPFSQSDRHEQVGPRRKITAYTGFLFPGRRDNYSDFKWNSSHFKCVGNDESVPGENSVYLLDGKTFDDDVTDEKGNFDFLIGCDVDVTRDDVKNELKQWGEWLQSTLAFDGVRFDAVKHVNATFFLEWLQHLESKSAKEIFAVGECWSEDLNKLNSFIDLTNRRLSLFDVPLQMNFVNASKTPDEFDLRRLFDNTLVASDPALAVTFVSNHDTQALQSLESVVENWFIPLAYAAILLRKGGYPCVFHGDYFGSQYVELNDHGVETQIQTPNHKSLIDKLLLVRKDFAFGEQYDFFISPEQIGWVRTGDEDHSGGIAVVLSIGGDCSIDMSHLNANATYFNITSEENSPIVTDLQGNASFHCTAKSISVWVQRK